MEQKLLFTDDVNGALRRIVSKSRPAAVFVLVDENTAKFVLPRLDLEATPITIPAGDEHKTLDTLAVVWDALRRGGATRHALLVNLGGGMVTDLGGMAAATFKRGIPFVNVPTTLLSAVDAAVGGKTGINYGGLKNEVGVFAPAADVIVSTMFFDTLPQQALWAGYAEMLRHAMLTSDAALNELLAFEPTGDRQRLLTLLKASVEVKRRIVENDPCECGPRKALNLGHTVGHAFESLALQRACPVPHGYAVAWGLVVEGVLSHTLLGFPSSTLHRLAAYIYEHYGTFHITCDDYDALLAAMRHDKKSRQGEINCTLLAACGDVRLDQAVDDDEMKTALDLYRDLFHI